jgi:hypothetical protein
MDTEPPASSPTASSEPPTTAASHNSEDEPSASEMAVYVGLPLIIAVFLAIVALLLLLVYFLLRAKNKQKYSKVPRQEGRLTNLSALPYPTLKPPAIKIDGAPAPDMSFTIAPQLPDPAASQRYPFLKHKRQQNKTIYGQEKEKKQKKHGNGKRNGKNASAEQDRRTADSGTHSASPPDHVSPNHEACGVSKGRKSSLVSLSQFGEQHAGAIADAFMISAAKKQVGRSSGSADKLPEIYLSLTYLREKTTLVVNVERVMGLPPRDDGAEVDAYVRLFFVPRLPEMAQRKTSKTRTAKRELDPVFHEEIQYEAMSEEELINSTLHVQVLDYRAYGRHSIIGQGELCLGQVPLGEDKEPVVLELHASRTTLSHGTVLLSLCYSTDTKKLSVILLRAKDLNRDNCKETDPQAKIQVTIGEKVIGRLRTKRKSDSCSPIFNEALTCSVDPASIQRAVITVCVSNEHRSAARKELGSIALSSQGSGEEFRHWNDVLAQPGKHIAEWHELRQR